MLVLRVKAFCLLHALLAISLLSGGCSSVGKITNVPIEKLPEVEQRYAFTNHVKEHGIGNVLFVLAFSGGGTRAAALSYGVLEELGSTFYESGGKKLRLLDEVDRISSVSGGSFTAAYYGLFGDQIFDKFKNDFLYKDIQGELTGRIYYDFFHFMERQFTGVSRTEDAIDLYDQQIFKGKTFADLQSSGNPFVSINATDLNSHSQFVFSQDYFDLLCSDLSQLKVARAVAASSAVPILFSPVLIENYHDCNRKKPTWLIRAEEKAFQENNLRLQDVVKSLEFYLDPDNPPYATLVDGGVTDNLGLRASLANLMIFEGTKTLQSVLHQATPIKHVVVLIVNASTTAVTDIGKSTELPSAADVFTAVTDIQLHRYNLDSSSLLKNNLVEWTRTLSSRGEAIEPYFIELSVDDVKNEKEFIFFNKIPTSFTLEQEQVDNIINTAKRLLRKDPEYQKLLDNLGASGSSGDDHPFAD
ncbi:MAG: patatin-like phospholipase family protein [Thermodesulfobacteriota bacterium]|nr:patatin-like phospholipase family protein [Thermodesulfobacteriota bacterium]